MAPDDRDDDRTESMGDSDSRPDRPRIDRLGHFRIESTLGAGGMGTIYRAYDESMKRPVALKVLHTALEISEQAQTRFVREAWIAGQLDHPNIVKVYSRGEEKQVSYLAMELIEGGSLYDYVEQTRQSIPSGSDVTATIDQDYINDVLSKFIELAAALEHIHTKGFIHRDIKPQNILLAGTEKNFKLTDFGIAHAEDMTRMTRAGDFIGTVKYMSPELLAAHRAGIDKRTDIYSLGITLYETLTLTLPFKADSEEKLIGEILAGHYTEARQSNRRIPVDLETVLMKACHYDPSMRYQTAAEFAEDMQRIVDGRPILAKRPGLFSRGCKYLRRNYKAVIGITAALVVVASAVFWSFYQVERAYRSTADQRPETNTISEPTFTKIDVPGKTENCALSLDGKRIAFVAEDKCLWVAPTRGLSDSSFIGEPVKLTGPIAPNTLGSIPTWSADGQWIAFNGKGNSEDRWADTLAIYVVPSSGGEARKLPIQHDLWDAYFDLRISLSPDGNDVAFFSHTSPVKSDTLKNCIYTMTVGGGEIQRLTGPSCGQPAHSPNGKMLAYVKGDLQPWALGDTLQSDVWVMPVDGGAPMQVSDIPGISFSPLWSPDSRAIVFSQWKDVGDGYSIKKLYFIQLSDRYEPIGRPVEIDLPLWSDGYHFCGWSDQNQIGILLWSPSKRDEGIYRVSANGGIATKVTAEPGFAPKWSPDGERVFYIINDSIRSISLRGATATGVPLSGDYSIRPFNWDISPDGESLIFPAGVPPDSIVDIYTVPIRGGTPTPFIANDTISYVSPEYSPDGKWVSFISYYESSSGTQIRLCVTSSDGSVIRELASHDACVSFSLPHKSWSPDSKRIAYASCTPDSSGSIRVISLDGSTPELLHELLRGSHVNSVDWSPDGDHLCYTAGWRSSVDERQGFDIWILSLDTRELTRLQTRLDLEWVDDAEWSPDGDQIVFYCDWSGSSDFYLMENFLPSIKIAEPEPPRGPIFSAIDVPGLMDYCALSPDGKRIAYASDSCLWVAPTRGAADPSVAGEPQKLAGPMNIIPLVALPIWSADGEWIAFNGEPENVNPGHGRASIFVVPSSGGEVRQVPVVFDWAGSWNCFRISLSPDGERVAFYSLTSPIPGDSGSDCIYTMPVAGGEILRLTDSPCRQPAFSPDGRMLAFVQGHQESWGYDSLQSDIWVIPVDGGPSVQITDLPGRELSPVWSPDSRAISFFRWAKLSGGGYGFPELYVTVLSESYEPIGSPIVVDLPQPSDDFIGGWSSEDDIGVVTESEPFAAIFTVSVSGGLASQITPSVSYSPSWSADGDRVFYKSIEREIRSVAAVGGPASTVPITGKSRVSAVGLDVSPDGQRLALVGVAEGDSTRDIFTVSVGGGELIQISSGPASDWFPAWSPDGKWIAFDRFEGLKDLLCVVPASGGEVRILVRSDDSTGYSGYPVSWSPDGQFIAYPSYQNGSRRCVSIVPFEGGDPETVIELSPGVICNSVSWSPDGTQLAYCTHISEYGGTSSDVWILHLDTKKPVRLRFGHDLDEIESISWSPDGKTLAFDGERIQKNRLYLISDFLPED